LLFQNLRQIVFFFSLLQDPVPFFIGSALFRMGALVRKRDQPLLPPPFNCLSTQHHRSFSALFSREGVGFFLFFPRISLQSKKAAESSFPRSRQSAVFPHQIRGFFLFFPGNVLLFFRGGTSAPRPNTEAYRSCLIPPFFFSERSFPPLPGKCSGCLQATGFFFFPFP